MFYFLTFIKFSVCDYETLMLIREPILSYIFMNVILILANPSLRQPLACWDCGFESHRGHGCLSNVSVVCCLVEVCGSGPEEPYRVWCV